MSVDKNTLKKIKSYARKEVELQALREKLDKHYLFEGLSHWGVTAIHQNCEIKDGKLYDHNGDLLSRDGGCMDEAIPYFVNQSTGYCGDDYYGTMFVKVDEQNTFVAISYEC